MSKTEDKRVTKLIEIYQKALDDLVTVNSLFTIAVFVGLSFATPSQRSLDDREECNAEIELAKTLVVFEVIAFSLYLFSSLVAKTLKVDLSVYQEDNFEKHGEGNLKLSRQLLLYAAVGASVLGGFFLLISMVYVIQIKLGKLSCRSGYTLIGAVALIIIVLLALFIYVGYAIVAMHKSFHLPPDQQQNSEAQNKGDAPLNVISYSSSS